MIGTALARARDHLYDAAALVVVGVSQVQAWSHADHPNATTAAFALLAAGPLLLRRFLPAASPLLVAAFTLLFTLVDPAAAYDTSSLFFVLLVAAWAAGSLSAPARAGVALFAVLVAGWSVMLRAPGVPASEVLWISVPLTGIFILSAAYARRAAEVEEVQARAERLEREAEAAKEEERRRITRELHDVLAHSVSVMTVQASAVRRNLTPDQVREREALVTVEDTGRQALAEMRRLLGIIRAEDDSAALAPQPGIETLPQLLDQVRQSGLPVELSVEGTPVELAAGVDLSAYRIVQEALTNALKHAGKAHAWVNVRWEAEGVEIEVANDGRTDAAGDGTGQGLVGMRERVALCGGELSSGPRPGGGFRISARLPVAGAR